MKQKVDKRGDLKCTMRRKCGQGSSQDLTASMMNVSYPT